MNEKGVLRRIAPYPVLNINVFKELVCILEWYTESVRYLDEL